MLSILSFSSGIIGFISLIIVICLRSYGLYFIIGCVIFSITGIVLSSVSIKKSDNKRALSIAGLIISIVTLVLLLILVMLIAALFIFFADFINAISGLGSMG